MHPRSHPNTVITSKQHQTPQGHHKEQAVIRREMLSTVREMSGRLRAQSKILRLKAYMLCTLSSDLLRTEGHAEATPEGRKQARRTQ